MKSNEESFRGMGYMCCGPRMGHGHAGFRLAIGMLLILMGLLWFGARMGWLDLTWIHSIPFWPMMVIIIGVCMVYGGLATKRTMSSEMKEVAEDHKKSEGEGR
jgi:hypothetical protein